MQFNTHSETESTNMCYRWLGSYEKRYGYVRENNGTVIDINILHMHG